MFKTILYLALLLLFLPLSPSWAQADPVNLLTNGGMESSGTGAMPDGWGALWTRDAGAGTAGTDTDTAHSGTRALRIVHHGTKDWSVGQEKMREVTPGDILALSGWVKYSGTGNAEISVVFRDRAGAVLDWQAGLMQTSETNAWTQLKRRLVVPAGGASVQFRFTGNGPGTAWLDDAVLTRDGDTGVYGSRLHGRTLHLISRLLDVKMDAEAGTLAVTDKRSGQTWRQQPPAAGLIVKDAVQTDPASLRLSVWDAVNDLSLSATITLSPTQPEIAVRVSASGPVTQPVAFPAPFVSSARTWLVVPMNEGILYPVDDASILPITLTTYSGHGLCMPWFGVFHSPDGSGLMAILRTPDDARIEITRRPGTGLFVQPEWEASRGAFGYDRALTYVFFGKGGYVAQAKRYRTYAQATGLFKTLAQKQKTVPAIGKLIGAVNVWNWDRDKVGLCREMRASGIARVLWSSGGSPAEVARINALGFLTSRYDIYQDVWPADAPSGLHHEGWPADLVRLPGGDWMKGWADKEKNADGTETVWQGGVINSQRGLARAKEVIPADLTTTAYRCRFLDTTTASPWREDYDPAHPLTRSQDRAYKMALLKFCAQDMHQVVGTETGIDPSVPYADYYEGMLSLGPYRLPDAGYDMIAYRTPTPDFLKFQVGHFYRVPLWELVYHECVVAQWYWGDATNKSPEAWPQRDLFNLLYATPPMFVFDKARWQKDKSHFVQTYQTVCPVARRLGYSEMLSHQFLTADHAVQQTRWSNGATITVNFGDTPYPLGKGQSVPALGSRITGLPAR